MPPLNNLQRSCIGLAIGHALIVSPALQAATITVNSTDDGPVGAVSGCTLREAIASTNTQAPQGGCAMTGAGPLDSIDFALPASSTIVLSEGELEITRTASITGPGATQLTIDAQGNSRIFNIDGYSSDTTGTSISGLTLTNGSTSGRGGAVYVRNTSGFTLSDSTISNSYSEVTGGGISANNSDSVSINDSTISGNSSFFGAGISLTLADNASISDSTITSNNSSSTGSGAAAGGILIFSSNSASISGSTISNNTVSNAVQSYGFGGGGIFVLSSDSSSISDSTISNNSTSEVGGGIFFNGGPNATIINSTISNNVADGNGGGINFSIISFYATITNSTISNNVANDGNGGGIYIDNSIGPTITNSTISTNVANDGNGGGIYISRSPDSTILYSTISTNVADNGGGIYIENSVSATIVNSTISTNVADDGNGGGNGGGLRSDNDNEVFLLFSTINSNTAVGQGGGIFTADSILENNNIFSRFRLFLNNVVANSVGGDIGGVCPTNGLSGGTWIEEGGPCLFNLNLTGDPMLGPLQDNGGPTLTHAPLPGSGLINGTTICEMLESQDQRGEPRGTDEGPCFVGAVEGIQESEDNFFVIPLGNGRSVVAPL